MSGYDESSNFDPVMAIDKLKTQNDKLRNQLKVLSRALDQALDRQKKQDRARARVPARDQAATQTERELQAAMSKINKYKRDIANMKKQLDGNLNQARITDLQNQSRYLTKRIQELEVENAALEKIEREQKKALQSANNAQGYPSKVQNLKQEIRQLKERYRELLAKQKQDERVLKDQHEKCVDLQEKCRKLRTVIKQKKQQDPDQPRQAQVSERDLEELELKIKETQQKKKEEEQRLKKRIKELETQIRDSKHNINTLNVKLREKDQECRLSMLKIKELRRAVRHNQLKPIAKTHLNASREESSPHRGNRGQYEESDHSSNHREPSPDNIQEFDWWTLKAYLDCKNRKLV